MPKALRVAVVQPAPVNNDPSHPGNPLKAAGLVTRASRLDPDIVVFPEYFPFHESRGFLDAVADSGVYVVAGIAYREGGRLYNTATIYSPEGYPLYRQRKRYVGRLERRLWGFDRWSGDYGVVDIGGVKLGVAVCADFWSFPEAALELFLGGADLFINPSYMFSMEGHWIKANLSRALDFYTPVVGVDMASFPLSTKRYTFRGGGLSHVIVPPSTGDEANRWWVSGASTADGWVRLKLGSGEDMGVYTIDVQGVYSWRRDWWRRMRGVELEEWMREARKRHRAAVLVDSRRPHQVGGQTG
ncbi:putative carbon-nitrogen hydrolase [Aeropyrum pernix K1]|uniref:Carbon-nitrogen hydrolase n=1 Tax=Aeropyrum pernix (strain ATCC 700893 / DSM 11879 / JCM 9820 / NBRC 100138 / K1) TaxID=272557 RepID=Q9YA84_AERPE|nr:carbon-nitrogen hydrolase family protein [Aeropyrum pernix]BAA81065.2 putative carbon-nitrogen hydrolase [Aeropyrum pernix K1]